MTAVNKTATAAELLEKISPEVLEMSAKIVPALTIDVEKESGVISAELYAQLLPEGLTMDLAKQLQDHHSVLYPALAHAVGTTVTPLMAEHAELKKVVVEMKAVGKDNIVVNFDRERTFADNTTKGTITKAGQVNIAHNTYGTKNRGEVTKVKGFLTALAFESLSGAKK